jgi:hypothetical protein
MSSTLLLVKARIRVHLLCLTWRLLAPCSHFVRSSFALAPVPIRSAIVAGR